MRLAIITNFASYHNVDLFNALHKEPGVELMVFYLRRMTPDRQWSALRPIAHAHQFVREWPWHRHFYLSPGLARTVDAFHPDALVITQYASIGMQWLMYRTALKRQTWVFWAESPGVAYSELPIFKTGWLRRAARRVALLPLRVARPSEVWGIGERAMELYAQATHAPVRNVPYYSDQTAFRAISRGPVASPVRFLYAGKLNYRKGFDLLVDAIARLGETRRDFLVEIMGDGPARVQIERLSPVARELVRFIGFKELRDVPAVFAECDVLVFPSRYDGWGMAVVEAMAAGMPVIASVKANSAHDLQNHGVTGYLMDSLDTHSLVSAMTALLDAPERIRAMGKRARERAASVTADRGAHVIADLVRRLPQARDRS
jgi:glycosyltransferase involved in cell wall biosynthesis